MCKLRHKSLQRFLGQQEILQVFFNQKTMLTETSFTCVVSCVSEFLPQRVSVNIPMNKRAGLWTRERRSVVSGATGLDRGNHREQRSNRLMENE